MPAGVLVGVGVAVALTLAVGVGGAPVGLPVGVVVVPDAVGVGACGDGVHAATAAPSAPARKVRRGRSADLPESVTQPP
jgi:hypothetical protein